VVPAISRMHSGAITNSGSDGLYVVTSRQTLLSIPRIVKFAGETRVPSAGGFGGWARAGGLLSYGPNVNDMTRLAASYVDKIFKGARPGDLPVQQPTKFELVINAKAARSLGFEVPPTLLARADEVIE
jgi:putative ABC transport system substrate-binding protein